MPTVTVKNISVDLYERLKQSAKANHRSINSEIMVCIERSLYSRKLNPAEILTGARLSRKNSRHPITDEEFSQAKVIGRL